MEICRADNDSFMYSLTRGHEQTLNKMLAGRNFERAVRSHPYDMLSMGYGADLRLFNECNRSDKNYANIGGTFRAPKGLKFKSYEA